MKTEVLEPQKPSRLKLDSFEEDWKNGISGKEFVKSSHEHIKEWWRANKGNRKA
jgi:hypothetical protein